MRERRLPGVPESSRLGLEGIDPDPEAVAPAQAAGVNARVGTAATLTAPDGAFDAAVLNHVIEHLHDPAKALPRVRERLTPGGILWLATPNPAAPGHRLFGRDWFGLEVPRHLVLFRDGLSELLGVSGFPRSVRTAD